ncbi:chemotaxis protein CheD [Candidatus Contubernalis alkaliaceticus]|uniref:chemotaxis protein CheD n=1 Tax=Candidatus Contubernalis alkaliaceticus TaxID=338645 RepID=UPI001F4BF1F8|nr:chemotaxis protein CheD [Candidatus Contubernalis alkalaceticus]UNC91779.1 chemotaxis protein CheD [Candidatus Contubernalis alkalaceticus]
MENVVRVKIADLAVLKKEGILVTIGLGSCVGIALYDPLVKVAGLSHIILSNSTLFSNRDNLAKFADTAVPLMLTEMIKLGARKERIRAKIAGGSELFKYKFNGESIGEKNIKAVIETLALVKIPLLSQDVGGNSGRTMKLLADSGQVLITKVGQKEVEL